MISTKEHVSVGKREEDGDADGSKDGLALGKRDEDGDFDGDEDGLSLGEGDGAAAGVCVGMGCAQLSMLNEYAPVPLTAITFRPESW